MSKDVRAFRVSQEGYVLYTHSSTFSSAHDLFSAPADGSAKPTLLSEGVEIFDVTPDGGRAVFVAYAFGIPGGLHVRAVDGASPSQLVGPRVSSVQELALSSDGQRAVCRTASWDEDEQDIDEQLLSVDLDGSGLRRIDGGAIDSDVQSFVISPDGSMVAYFADTPQGIHVVPIDGSQPPLQVGTGYSFFHCFSSDGQRVLSSRFVSPDWGLYSAPVSGGPPVLLNPGTSLLDTGSPVVAGDYVYFLARGAVANIPHLYRAPADGSATAIRLDAPFTAFAGSGVHAFRLLAGGTHVVYAATVTAGLGDQLFRVPTDGSQAGVELSGPFVNGGGVILAEGFTPSPDGTRVAFVADSVTDEVFELFSAPSDGSAAPVRLGPALAPGADVEPGHVFTPDGQAVLYRVRDPARARIELHIAASATAGVSARLDDEFTPGGEVVDVVLGPGGQRAFYRADRTLDETFELFSVRLATPGAPVRLSNPLQYEGPASVAEFFLAPDGGHVVYHALLGDDYRMGLHARELRGAGRERDLTDSAHRIRDVLGFSVDGRIVYTATNAPSSSAAQTYSAPLDGSASPVAVSRSASHISPDGRWVAFAGGSPGILVSASTDGASGEIVLATAGELGSLSLAPAPDNTHILYTAADGFLQPFELYSTRLDGTVTPLRISAAVGSGYGARLAFASPYSPDGTAVLYRADDRVVGREELFIAPVDGSFPARRLNGTLAANGADVLMARFTPDGTRVAYAAQQDGDGQVELYVVPSDGSLPSTRLTSTGFFVLEGTRLSDTHAFFVAGALGHLWRVPLDGSALPERLTTASNVRALTLTPDGRRLAFLATSGLFSVLADGSAGALLGQDVSSFQLSRSGARVVFRASDALFGAPVEGGTTPTRLSLGLEAIQEYTLTPDGSRVLFLAQEDSSGPRELYQSFLVPAHRAR